MNPFINFQVNAEIITDERGSFISLQLLDGGEDLATVNLHPWQLRAACEHFGVIASELVSAKSIASLERRLMGLRDRIETLRDYLCKNSDHKDFPLSVEATYATATLEIANEFCMGLCEHAGGLPTEG